MRLFILHGFAAALFLALGFQPARASAQPRLPVSSPDALNVATSGLILSEWNGNILVFRAARPGDLPATEVNVRRGLRRLYAALTGGSDRPTEPSPHTDDGATQKHPMTGLAVTRWDRFGVTLTAPDPWDTPRHPPQKDMRGGGPNEAPRFAPEASSGGQGRHPDHEEAHLEPGATAAVRADASWVNPPPLSDGYVDALRNRVRSRPTEASFQALADALFSRADWSGLLEVARQWLAFAPSSPGAREALGMAHLSLGHHDQAVTIFEAMAAAAPGDPMVADRAGVLLLVTHRADLAEPLFLEAMAADASDPVPVRHLALLLWQLERPEEAVRLLEQFLDSHAVSGHVRETLLGDLALVYRAALDAGGDDWDIRVRAARRGAPLQHWDDVRVVVEWRPPDEPVALHLAQTWPGSGKPGRVEERLVPPAASSSGLVSVRVAPPLPGRWHVGAGTPDGTRGPVTGTVMVIAPAFRDRIALVLLQPFTLAANDAGIRHLLSFDLPGGPPPPDVEGETRIEP